MALIAAFMLNASLNFAIALVIAKALGPEEFGRYALATSIVAILSTLLFEGLRFATVRFYSDRTRSDEPAIRATLEIGHAFLSLVLLSLAGTMLLFGVELGGLSSWSLAAVLGAVLGQSLFEYHGALARARFQRWVYVRLIVVKNIAALCLMMGGAFYFHDANVVLIGLAVSALSGVAAVRCSLGDPETRLRLARPTLLRDFFVYAIPLIAANAIYTLTYFMNRSWLASHNGLAEVGQFSLAWDLCLRVFIISGSALDILLFQLAVRAAEAKGPVEGHRQLGSNATLIIVLILPLMAGFWVDLPAIDALIIPAAYQHSFMTYTTILMPGFLAAVLIQFVFTPVFQLRKRTSPVIVAAVVGLALDGCALLVLPGWYGPSGVAMAQLVGLLAATGVLGCLAILGQEAVRFSGRDVALSLLATSVMTGLTWPLRDLGSPLLSLFVTISVGITIYGGFVWFMDLASLRTFAQRGVRRLQLGR
jgi:O-antigen/teichoic acid export membrane protein